MLDFLCVGAQKSATTTIHEVLSLHENIHLPESKELHFFDIDENFNKGLKWYEEQLFRDAEINDKMVFGEVTPDYLYIDGCAERIRQCFGEDLKIIICLRHPVDRAISHYNMSYKTGVETRGFEEAFSQQYSKYTWPTQKQLIDYSYRDKGLYAKQISKYMEYFCLENMLFLCFEEDFRDGSLASLQEKLSNFLGVSCDGFISPSEKIPKKNEGFAPRLLWVNRLLKSQNIGKKVLGCFMPARAKIAIVKFVYSMNSSRKGRLYKSRVSDLRRKEIFDDFFSEDARKLLELTGIDFYEKWAD